MSTRKRLGDLLIETGTIDEFQLSSALAHQRQSGGALGRILVDSHFITESTLAQVLSAQLGLPVVNLDEVAIHPKVIEEVTIDEAEHMRIVPVRIQQAETRGSVLFLAMSDPTNADAIDTIQFKTGKRVAPMLATESAIERAIRRHYYAESIQTATIVDNDVQFSGAEFELDDTAAEVALDRPVSPPPSAGKIVDDEIPVVTGAALTNPAVDDWMLGRGNPLHLGHATLDLGMLELVAGQPMLEEQDPPSPMALSSADLASLGLGGGDEPFESVSAVARDAPAVDARPTASAADMVSAASAVAEGPSSTTPAVLAHAALADADDRAPSAPAWPASPPIPTSTTGAVDDSFGPPPPDTGFGLSTGSATFDSILESLPDAPVIAKSMPDDAEDDLLDELEPASISSSEDESLPARPSPDSAAPLPSEASSTPVMQTQRPSAPAVAESVSTRAPVAPRPFARIHDVSDLRALEREEPNLCLTRAALADDALILAGAVVSELRIGSSAFMAVGVETSSASFADTFAAFGTSRRVSSTGFTSWFASDPDAPDAIAPGAFAPLGPPTGEAPVDEKTGPASWHAFAESQIVANRLSLDDNTDTQSLRLRFMEIRSEQQGPSAVHVDTSYVPLPPARAPSVPPWAAFSTRLDPAARAPAPLLPPLAAAPTIAADAKDASPHETHAASLGPALADVSERDRPTSLHDEEGSPPDVSTIPDIEFAPAGLAFDAEASPTTALHDIPVAALLDDGDLEFESRENTDDHRTGFYPEIAFDDVGHGDEGSGLALDDREAAASVDAGQHGGVIDVDALALTEIALEDDAAAAPPLELLHDARVDTPRDPQLVHDTDTASRSFMASDAFATPTAAPREGEMTRGAAPESLPSKTTPRPFDEMSGLDSLLALDAPSPMSPLPVDVRAIAIPVGEESTAPIEREPALAPSSPAAEMLATSDERRSTPLKAVVEDAPPPPALDEFQAMLDVGGDDMPMPSPSAPLDIGWETFIDDDVPVPVADVRESRSTLSAMADMPVTSAPATPVAAGANWALPDTLTEVQEVSSEEVTASVPENEALELRVDDVPREDGAVPSEDPLAGDTLASPTATMITRLSPDELRILASRLVARGVLTREDYEKAKRGSASDDENGGG
jgi:hypothetical protein